MAGNYVFAKVAGGRWSPVYAGETEDLSNRFDYHHRMPCINRHGATHIHARVNLDGRAARLDEESDIRWAYDPPCNRQ